MAIKPDSTLILTAIAQVFVLYKHCALRMKSYKIHRHILDSNPQTAINSILLIVTFFVLIEISSPAKTETLKDDTKMTIDICDTSLSLHKEIYGEGRPIVFLHGFGASIYSWRYLVDPLKNDYQLIMFDLKGFGLSPKPNDECYAPQDQANLIYNYIIEQDLRNVTIVGHSYGGGVALITATKLTETAPDRLSSIILIDSVAYKQNLPTFIDLLRTPFVAQIGLWLISSKYHTRSILKLAYYDNNRIKKDQITAYAKPINSTGGRRSLIKIAKQIIPPNIEEISSKYSIIIVPTLIIWGKQDKIVPLKVGEKLHQSIKNSKMIVIDHCGHIPHEEMPIETINEVIRFLSDTKTII